MTGLGETFLPGTDLACRAVKLAAAAALLVVMGTPLSARAEAPALTCDMPLDLVRLAYPLSHLGQKLAAGDPVTIVAIGSSSTAGAGASSPAHSYPSQLGVELKQHFPAASITVLNRGVNGEEAADMLKRFDQAVLAAKPDLVLWQLGTNSVIRNHQIIGHDTAIRDGLKKVRAVGADLVLIDPQFAPKVIVKPEAEQMVNLIAATAKAEDVDLFHRFAVMKRWYNEDHIKFESFVSPDGLHMNDWSYGCFAHGLALALAEAAERPTMSATAFSHLVP